MDFQPSTPQLPVRSPKGFNDSLSQSQSQSSVSCRPTPKANSERDNTLSSMLSALRQSHGASVKAPAGVSATSANASMFLTQSINSRDFATVEEEASAESDSDVSVSAFRSTGLGTKNSGVGFNDSTHSMADDALASPHAVSVINCGGHETGVAIPLTSVLNDVDLQSLDTL